MRGCRWHCWVLLAAVLVGMQVPARGDDWAQFRKDAEHSGASKDPVKLPLTEIWTWTRQYPNAGYYVMNAAVYKGRVFFVSREAHQSFLICTDAGSGVVIWKQALASLVLNNQLSGDVAPAVGPDGMVYVYDLMLLPKIVPDFVGDLYSRVLRDTMSGTDVDARDKLRASLIHYARGYLGLLRGLPDPPPGLRITKSSNGGLTFSGSVPIIRNAPNGQPHVEQLPVSVNVSPGPTFVVRTFSAADGKPGPFAPIDPWLNTETINYTALLHPPYPQGYAALSFSDGAFPVGVGLGPPTVFGGRLIASTTASALVDWSPGNLMTGGTLQSTLIHHPLPGFEPFYTPLASLLGFPPLALPGGILLGDDTQHRFLASLGVGTAASDWHLDIHGSLGIPASKDGMAYLGVLGSRATRAIICLDPGNGAIQWRYAPTGMPNDPQRVERDQLFGTGSGASGTGSRAAVPGRRTLITTKKGEPIPAAPSEPTLSIPQRWSDSGQGGFHFRGAPHGWNVNPGLAITDDAVYGVASQEVVALERSTGALKWRVPLAAGTGVKSLIVSGPHLFLTTYENFGDRPTPVPDREALVALRLKDGKKVWEDEIHDVGTLAAANGMVFMSNGTLHAYGPAERTYRMAVDSGAREDYLLHPLPDPQPGAADVADAGNGPAPTKGGVEVPKPQTAPPADAAKPANDAKAPKSIPRMREVADATVLRLSASEPVEQLAARCKARRELLPGLPMLVTLDPFNATRESWLRFSDSPALSAEWDARYAEICGKVAAAGRPEYLEVLPEVNAYLVRDMDWQAPLKALIRTVLDAVHAASPETKVVVSLNAEVLNTSYSRGDYRPFGKLPAADPRTLKPSMELAAMADAVGLTAYPQSGAIRSADIPSSYLTSIRTQFGKKPVLVTRLAMVVDEALEPKVPGVQREQAALLQRLLQNCYWLDAPIVAYPEVVSTEKSAPAALRTATGDRAALGVWQGVLRWKRVEKLTLLKTQHEKEQEAPAAAAAN